MGRLRKGGKGSGDAGSGFLYDVVGLLGLGRQKSANGAVNAIVEIGHAL